MNIIGVTESQAELSHTKFPQSSKRYQPLWSLEPWSVVTLSSHSRNCLASGCKVQRAEKADGNLPSFLRPNFFLSRRPPAQGFAQRTHAAIGIAVSLN